MYTREQFFSTGDFKKEEKQSLNQYIPDSLLSEDQHYEGQRSSIEIDAGVDERRKNDRYKFINKLKQFEKNSYSEIKTGPHSTSVAPSFEPSTRKERNKIAARQTRDRKKLYVQLMEGKIQTLENELEQTVKDIEKVRLQIFSAEMRQGTQGKESNHRQVHIMKKLEGLLENQSLQDRNNQINICLDSIMYRIGATGKERKSALTKLYFDLLNFSQPALYRYILWSAVHSKHLFGDISSSEDQKWCREIEQLVKQVNQNPNNKNDLDAIGEQLTNQFLFFKKYASDLVEFRAKIQKKGQILDNCLSQMRQILTPEQMAKVIVFVEKYQFKKEVRLFEEQDLNEISRPYKKVKIQENDEWF